MKVAGSEDRPRTFGWSREYSRSNAPNGSADNRRLIAADGHECSEIFRHIFAMGKIRGDSMHMHSSFF
jgi:hypothetical protein